MSAGCYYCYRTAWWECKKCGAIMCDKCDPLHKCLTISIFDEVVDSIDVTPYETDMFDIMSSHSGDIG